MYYVLYIIIYCVDDFEFEVFGIVFVCHVEGDDALKQIFVDASGGYMIDKCLHTLQEVASVPIMAVIKKKPGTDRQSHTFVGVLEIMTGA